MIIAKYIFTISVDEEWNRTIQCELPPHDLTTREWLLPLKKELLQVYSHILDMYEDCNKMLLEFPEEWNNLTDLHVESEKQSTEKQ